MKTVLTSFTFLTLPFICPELYHKLKSTLANFVLCQTIHTFPTVVIMMGVALGHQCLFKVSLHFKYYEQNK